MNSIPLDAPHVLTIIGAALAICIVFGGIWCHLILRRPLLRFIEDTNRLYETINRSDDLRVLDPSTLSASDSPMLTRAVAELRAGALAGNCPPGEARRRLNDDIIGSDVSTLRMLDAVPNLFVGFGLAVTFTLLALAIYFASEGLSQDGNGAMSGLEGAMQSLLATASWKFVTSIAAIGVSLWLILRRTRLLSLADTALANLAAAFERHLPLVAQGGAADIAHALAKQADIMGNIEARLAGAIAERETLLAQALSAALQPLTQAVATMGDRIAKTNAETMERMVKAFTDELGGATLRYNQDLAETLKATTVALHDAPGKIRTAADATVAMLEDVRTRTESVIVSSHGALDGTANRLEAIARQASAAEAKLSTDLDKASAEANAAFERMQGMTDAAEVARAQFDKVADKVATTNSALADTQAAATAAASVASTLSDTMKSDVSSWQTGMAAIDVKVGTLLGQAAAILATKAGKPRDGAEKP